MAMLNDEYYSYMIEESIHKTDDAKYYYIEEDKLADIMFVEREFLHAVTFDFVKNKDKYLSTMNKNIELSLDEVTDPILGTQYGKITKRIVKFKKVSDLKELIYILNMEQIKVLGKFIHFLEEIWGEE